MIKAIAYHPKLNQSVVSQSFYRVDYEYDPDQNDESLSISDYNNALSGKWIGNAESEWVLPYNIALDVSESGNYRADAISTTFFIENEINEQLVTAFYYFPDVISSANLIEITGLDSNNMGIGVIKLTGYSNNVITDSIRSLRFTEDQRVMRFIYKRNDKEIEYTLTRLSD